MTSSFPEPDQLSPGTKDVDAGFAGNVMKLVGATTLAQLLAMFASPVVTRLYGPEAFGVYAVFLSITGGIIPVVCLRYELAIVLPRSDEEAVPLLWVSLIFALFVALVTGPLLFLFRQEIEVIFNAPGLGQWLLLIPGTLLSAGVFVALNYWNTRTKKFGRLSIAQLTRSVAIVGTQIGAGFAGFVSGGSLIVAAFFGYLGAALMLGGLIWREDHAVLRQGLHRSAMVQGLRRYRNFPLIDSWSALLTSLSGELPVLLLATFFSTAVVGAYSLCLTVLQIPMKLVGSSLGQVFYSTAAPAKHAGENALAYIVEETEIRLIILGFLPFMVLALTGQVLFTFVFGAPWAEAGVYAQILAPWIMITFLSVPISGLFSVLEMQRYSLILNVVILPLRVGALAVGGLVGSPRMALALFSALGVVYTGAVAVSLVRRSGGSVRRILIRVRAFLFYAVVILAMIMIVQFAFADRPVIIAVAAVGMIPYYWAVIRRDPVIRSPFASLLHRCGIPVPKWLEA